MRGARVVADAVGEVLDGTADEDTRLKEYEANCRGFLNVIVQFVRFFYDQTKTREEYYDGAQDIIDPDQEEPAQFDFVKLVSGLATEDDDVVLRKLMVK